MGGIEDVSGHDQGIDIMLADGHAEEVEKAAMFFLAGQITQRLAEMPICRVDDAEIRPKLGGNVMEQIDALTNHEFSGKSRMGKAGVIAETSARGSGWLSLVDPP